MLNIKSLIHKKYEGRCICMIYAVRKPNESVDKLINRFKKQVQSTRMVLQLRKGRYHQKKLTRTKEREGAVMREKHRTERAKKMYY